MGKFLKAKKAIGRKFGRLTIIAVAPRKRPGARDVEARCDCGKTVVVRFGHIMAGRTSSCGCLSADMTGNRKRIHGLTDSRVHHIWNGLVQRCTNPLATNYANYGGRGIQVCERWRGKTGFVTFVADMGLPPTEKHEIDRINNNGNYEPGNVRWVTHQENVRNTRANRLITFQGKTLTMAEWAEKKGMPYSRLLSRIGRGWPIADALNLPEQRAWGFRKPKPPPEAVHG